MNRRGFIWCLCAVAAVLACAQVRAADYYVHARTGSSGNTGLTSGSPKQTIAQILAAGFASAAGDRLFMAGSFREQLRLSWQAGHVCDRLWIGQWAGQEQAVIRGDTATTTSAWNVTARAGVFSLAISAGTVPYWVNTGDANNHYTLTEGIVDVAINWDTSIDANGYHFGHLTQSDTHLQALTDSAAAITAMDDHTWMFVPAAVGASGGGGGTLYINLQEYANDAALDAAAPVITYVIGNRNGIEIGTPTYTTYPAWGAYDGRNVTNCTIDGLHVIRWSDSGYRKNKPASNGQGDDNTAYDGGNERGTVSVGYGIRPADWQGGRIVNCVAGYNGYHQIMYVGDHCIDNYIGDCVLVGGGVNPYSGGSSGMFYTGPGAGYDNANNVKGCVAERVTVHRFTLLGMDGACVPSPLDGTDDTDPIAYTYCSYDGMLIHTNARSGSISAFASGTGGVARATTTHAMYDNEYVTITASSEASYVGTWQINYVDGTHFELLGCPYVQDATATYFSASNVVEDVEFRDCKDIQVGDLTTHTTCPGSAYIGGARSNRASDPTNWRTYPIRHIGCEQIGGATNLVSNSTDLSFFRCRFALPRAGIDAGGPAMGSNSGYQNVNFTSCEIVANLGHTTGTREIFKLNFDDEPNKGYFVGTSVYNTGDRATVSTQWMFTIQNDTTGTLTSAIANRVYARQSVFAHRYCTSTTDLTGPTRGFISGGGVNWSTYNGGTNPSVPFNIRDCAYANIQTTQWITWAGAGTSYGAEAAYTSTVDPTGVYFGQDPTAANIALGHGIRRPFADESGKSLRLTGSAQQRRLTSGFLGFAGINGLMANGNYGAWQYGRKHPQQVLADRVLAR